MVNLRSSIHVTTEFVAPEHISDSVRITEELRQLPAAHLRRTDVLNVRSLLVSRAAPQVRLVATVAAAVAATATAAAAAEPL